MAKLEYEVLVQHGCKTDICVVTVAGCLSFAKLECGIRIFNLLHGRSRRAILRQDVE